MVNVPWCHECNTVDGLGTCEGCRLKNPRGQLNELIQKLNDQSVYQKEDPKLVATLDMANAANRDEEIAALKARLALAELVCDLVFHWGEEIECPPSHIGEAVAAWRNAKGET